MCYVCVILQYNVKKKKKERNKKKKKKEIGEQEEGEKA